MTLDDHGWTQFLAAVRREIPSWEVFATEARVRASRSSSGAEPGTPSVDECERIAYGRGFRNGVEAAAQIVAGWHIKRGGYLVLAEAIRALSSAPPSPNSGDRVRALEEALREARRCGDKLAKELRGWRDTYVSDDEEDPEGWLALDGWAKSSDARDRALSPQGDDGGTGGRS